jgi:hypothetical protein
MKVNLHLTHSSHGDTDGPFTQINKDMVTKPRCGSKLRNSSFFFAVGVPMLGS